MKRAASTIASCRYPPGPRVCPVELRVLREVSEHQADRVVVGSTLYDASELGRQAYVWTLNDGEHLILLMQAQRFCYWAPSRASLKELAQLAIDWLTEPPVLPFDPTSRGR